MASVIVARNNENNEVLLHEGDGLMCTETLTKCKNSVCLIKCSTNVPSPQVKRGSGFYAEAKVFDTLYRCIVTNHHVLSCEADACSACAIFCFEGDNPGEKIQLRPDKIFRTNKDLDYTVVGLDEEQLKNIHPSIFPLEYNEQPEAKKGDDVFIFQHPRGCPKKFSYEKIIAIENPYVFYSADTDEGSSGSPVLRKLHLMALHQKGNKQDNYNKGTLFSAIIEDLHTGNAVACGKRSRCDSVEDMEENWKRKCVETADGVQCHTQELSKTHDEKPSSKPDDKTLDNLSHECTGFYKHLARQLGVDNVKIEEISRDHINYRDDSEKCFHVFQEWKESESSPFTYNQLGIALRSLKKNALSNKYCGK